MKLGDYLIAVPPINQTVMEGDAVHFPCVTKDRTSTVTWFKDGIPLAELHELLLRALISPEGSLTLSPTRMGDLGEYACQVVGLEGDVQKTTAFLNVQCKSVSSDLLLKVLCDNSSNIQFLCFTYFLTQSNWLVCMKETLLTLLAIPQQTS